MPRLRVSTTVDESLIARARQALAPANDSSVLEEALRALLAQRLEAEIDAGYVAYDRHPLDEPDAWGDLASFGEAASSS
jgi:Arc/MetJ family transcription regulator